MSTIATHRQRAEQHNGERECGMRRESHSTLRWSRFTFLVFHRLQHLACGGDSHCPRVPATGCHCEQPSPYIRTSRISHAILVSDPEQCCEITALIEHSSSVQFTFGTWSRSQPRPCFAAHQACRTSSITVHNGTCYARAHQSF